MLPFFEALYNRFHELHGEIAQALEALPSEALDWKPGNGMNSASVIIVHLTSTARYFIGDFIVGNSSSYNREAGFQVKGMSKQDLLSRLSDTEAYLKSVFEKLSLADLDKQRLHPWEDNQVSIAWFILIALTHTATHLGHLQITVQIWQQQYAARMEAMVI